MAAPGPKYWCSGSLRIMDAPHLHEDISFILGEPSESHVIGEEDPDRPGKLWRNSIWILKTPISERNEIHEHLRWLCEFLQPYESDLHGWISAGARIDLYFSYACNDDHRGFGVPGDLLGIFSRLRIPLEVSIMT